VRRVTVIDDAAASLAGVLREALSRSPHLVVTTGGLGPAEDDRTLEGVAEVLGLPLALHTEARALVEAAYRGLSTRGVTAPGLTAAREKLCWLPVGSTAVANPLGVAPGVICRLAGGTAVLSLPGLPVEATAVLEASFEPLRLALPARRTSLREIESPTADESTLRPLLDRLANEFPGVSIHSLATGSPRSGTRIRIRLEATGADRAEAEDAVEGVVRRLLALAAGSP
jgi:molybdopterin-biosynthesis enzyme MoeA-like protein